MITSRTSTKAQYPGAQSGTWWRFSRYEIRDDRLRPAPDATLTPYDPWADYQRARLHGRGEPPYQSLLSLLDQVTASGRAVLTSVTRDALLDWCAEHGLLGVLPHRAQRMILAARWTDWEDVEEYAIGHSTGPLREPPPLGLADIRPVDYDNYPRVSERDPEPYFLVPATPGYVRFGERWVHTLETWGGRRPWPTTNDGDQRDRPVPRNLLPPEWPRPTLLWSDFQEMDLTTVPLGEAASRFFPGVPPEQRESYAYPKPLTERFWREYAEPIDDFLRAATALREASDATALIKKGKRATPRVQKEISEDLRVLHALTSPARPVLRLEGDELRHGWVTGSLLASFALMLMQDADEGWRVVQCEGCGRVVTTRDSRVRYCSEQCRWRLVKRAERWRAQRKRRQQRGGVKLRSRRKK